MNNIKEIIVYKSIYTYLRKIHKDLSYHGKKLSKINKIYENNCKNKDYKIVYFEIYKDKDFKINKNDRIKVITDTSKEIYINVNFGEKENSYLIESSLQCGVFAIYKRRYKDIFMNISLIFKTEEEAKDKIKELEKKAEDNKGRK